MRTVGEGFAIGAFFMGRGFGIGFGITAFFTGRGFGIGFGITAFFTRRGFGITAFFTGRAQAFGALEGIGAPDVFGSNASRIAAAMAVEMACPRMLSMATLRWLGWLQQHHLP